MINYIKPVTTSWGEVPLFSMDTIDECFKYIEKCGRICYKSEDKITADSAKGFIQRILDRGHLAVIEHSNMYIRTAEKSKNPLRLLEIAAVLVNDNPFVYANIIDGHLYIGGNIRSWMEFVKSKDLDAEFVDSIRYTFETLLQTDMVVLADNKQLPRPLRRFGFHFIHDRAFTHELVRHRPDCSYCQESQRYVRYDADVEVIEPHWFHDLSSQTEIVTGSFMATRDFQNSIRTSIETYQRLIGAGMTAQYARGVLPNAVKTEIAMTTNIDEWNKVLKVRHHKAAHPDMFRAMKEVNDVIIGEA